MDENLSDTKQKSRRSATTARVSDEATENVRNLETSDERVKASSKSEVAAFSRSSDHMEPLDLRGGVWATAAEELDKENLAWSDTSAGNLYNNNNKSSSEKSDKYDNSVNHLGEQYQSTSLVGSGFGAMHSASQEYFHAQEENMLLDNWVHLENLMYLVNASMDTETRIAPVSENDFVTTGDDRYARLNRVNRSSNRTQAESTTTAVSSSGDSHRSAGQDGISFLEPTQDPLGSDKVFAAVQGGKRPQAEEHSLKRGPAAKGLNIHLSTLAWGDFPNPAVLDYVASSSRQNSVEPVRHREYPNIFRDTTGDELKRWDSDEALTALGSDIAYTSSLHHRTPFGSNGIRDFQHLAFHDYFGENSPDARAMGLAEETISEATGPLSDLDLSRDLDSTLVAIEENSLDYTQRLGPKDMSGDVSHWGNLADKSKENLSAVAETHAGQRASSSDRGGRLDFPQFLKSFSIGGAGSGTGLSLGPAPLETTGGSIGSGPPSWLVALTGAVLLELTNS